VTKQLALASPRGRRRPGDLKEGEFLTLAMLQERLTMTVGEIQRELGVLPAQMSRIIRALESRGNPLIACRINPHDKRKVDVNLTDEGERVLSDYRRHRIGRILEVLRDLEDEEREQLDALLDRVRDVLRRHAGDE
jgi:DNA-binding MarR family transcriptional regulator